MRVPIRRAIHAILLSVFIFTIGLVSLSAQSTSLLQHPQDQIALQLGAIQMGYTVPFTLSGNISTQKMQQAANALVMGRNALYATTNAPAVKVQGVVNCPSVDTVEYRDQLYSAVEYVITSPIKATVRGYVKLANNKTVFLNTVLTPPSNTWTIPVPYALEARSSADAEEGAGNVTTLRTQVTGASSNASAALGAVNALSGNVTALANGQNALSTQITGASSNASAALGAVNALSGNVTALANGQNALSTQVTGASSNASAALAAVNALREELVVAGLIKRTPPVTSPTFLFYAPRLPTGVIGGSAGDFVYSKVESPTDPLYNPDFRYGGVSEGFETWITRRIANNDRVSVYNYDLVAEAKAVAVIGLRSEINTLNFPQKNGESSSSIGLWIAVPSSSVGMLKSNYQGSFVSDFAPPTTVNRYGTLHEYKGITYKVYPVYQSLAGHDWSIKIYEVITPAN